MKWIDRSVAAALILYIGVGIAPKSCQESENIEPFRTKYEQSVKVGQYDVQQLSQIEDKRDRFLRDKDCLLLGKWHVGSINGKYKAYTNPTPALCLNPFSSDKTYEEWKKD